MTQSRPFSSKGSHIVFALAKFNGTCLLFPIKTYSIESLQLSLIAYDQSDQRHSILFLCIV